MAGADVRSVGDGGENLHDPTAGENASFQLVWTGTQLDQIFKTVGDKTFRKDLVWSGGNPINISAWVEV